MNVPPNVRGRTTGLALVALLGGYVAPVAVRRTTESALAAAAPEAFAAAFIVPASAYALYATVQGPNVDRRRAVGAAALGAAGIAMGYGAVASVTAAPRSSWAGLAEAVGVLVGGLVLLTSVGRD